MEFGDIIRAAGVIGEGRAAFGAGTRFVPLDDAGSFVRPALGAMEAIRRVQDRANGLAARTEKVVRNPVTRASLGIPSERPAPQWLRTAASIAGAMPRPSAAAGMPGLPGSDFSRSSALGEGCLPMLPQDRARGWQSLRSFGDRNWINPPPVAGGFTTHLRDPRPAGARAPLLDSGVGELARTYHLPQAATTGLFELPPVFRWLGKLLQGYLDLFRRLGKLIAGWLRPIEGLFQQAKRAWELYPRDSEGRPIPFWNLRLYLLARAAYRRNSYEVLARFLDEIGADASPDNVLFVRDLLAPTFDPKRPDRRTNWWLLDPYGARRTLRKRLESIRSEGSEPRRGGELPYVEDPEDDENPNDPYFYVVKRAPRTISAETAFFDHELAALLLRELAAVLPERQYEVVSLASRGWTYERIAHEMGITVGAVKAHMHKVRNNPEVSEVLLPGSAFRPNGTQTRGRTHRK